jgi:hypothetical protein
MISLTCRNEASTDTTYRVVDVKLQSGNVPLDSFSFELYFDQLHTKVYSLDLSEALCLIDCGIVKEIDNKNGLIYVACYPHSPYYAKNTEDTVVATMTMMTELGDKPIFRFGDKTAFCIHG